MDVKELVNSIIADGQVTTEQQKKLLDAVSEDGTLGDEEAAEIKRLMKLINEGKLKVIR